MKRILPLLTGLLMTPLTVAAAEIDLRPQWDETIPLANPDKGWHHHFFDNHVKKYLPESDDDLLKFPGLDHIYRRLASAYLDPQEGRFDWRIVDEQIETWGVVEIQ
jgi:hypothetical protein